MHPVAHRPTPDGDQDLDDDAFDLLDQQQQQQQPVIIDLACLSGLSGLKLLQIDLRDLSIESEAPMMEPPPLHLTFSAAAVRQLAASCRHLVTLDLNGFTQDVLPDEAVVGISRFYSLENLSLLNPRNDQFANHGAEQQAAAGGVGSTQRQMLRSVGWWQLPIGLHSLCLSHIDLTRGSVELSNLMDDRNKHADSDSIDNSVQADIIQLESVGQQQSQQTVASEPPPDFAAIASLITSDASNRTYTLHSLCGRSDCCLAAPVESSLGNHAAAQQVSAASNASPSKLRSYLNLPSPRLSPTKRVQDMLGSSKRRRDNGDQKDNADECLAAAQQQPGAVQPVGNKQTSSGTSSGSSSLLDDGQLAALLTAAATDKFITLDDVCPCAIRCGNIMCI